MSSNMLVVYAWGSMHGAYGNDTRPEQEHALPRVECLTVRRCRCWFSSALVSITSGSLRPAEYAIRFEGSA